MSIVDRILPYHVVFGVPDSGHGSLASRHLTRRGAERMAANINRLIHPAIRQRYFVVRA